MKRVLEFIKAVAIWLFAYVAVYVGLAIFILAGLSYASGDHLSTIVATAVLAMALLVIQTRDRNTFWSLTWLRPSTWLRRIVLNTLTVGVAIHYSALIIGVSFGAVFSEEETSAWAMVAVLVKQAVLTRAAWILVNEYRKSNAANRRKQNTQEDN